MDIEFEAKFLNVDKRAIQKTLKKIGAKLIRPEFLQKRVVFSPPNGKDVKTDWLRVRDEGGKITLSLKSVTGPKITDQKEICLTVDDFKTAEELLLTLGCRRKAYQETRREIWKLGSVEIMIDEWPFIEPFVEIEGKSEKEVIKVSEKLGFDYREAFFGSAAPIISKKYHIPESVINNEISELVFGKGNPYLKWIKHTSPGAGQN